MRQTGEPNTLAIVAAGAVFVLLLVAAVFGLEAYYHEAEDDENSRKVVAVAPEELSRARAQQAEQIRSYRWVDRPKGIVAVPIDVAMELVVRDGAGPLAAPPAESPKASGAAASGKGN